MTPEDLARLVAAVDAQKGKPHGACIAVPPGQLAELLRVYCDRPGAQATVDDAMILRVLTTGLPGGAQVWHLVNGGGMQIDEGHCLTVRRVLEAYIEKVEFR